MQIDCFELQLISNNRSGVNVTRCTDMPRSKDKGQSLIDTTIPPQQRIPVDSFASQPRFIYFASPLRQFEISCGAIMASPSKPTPSHIQSVKASLPAYLSKTNTNISHLNRHVPLPSTIPITSPISFSPTNIHQTPLLDLPPRHYSPDHNLHPPFPPLLPSAPPHPTPHCRVSTPLSPASDIPHRRVPNIPAPLGPARNLQLGRFSLQLSTYGLDLKVYRVGSSGRECSLSSSRKRGLSRGQRDSTRRVSADKSEMVALEQPCLDGARRP